MAGSNGYIVPVGGMHRDNDPANQPDNTYRYALNQQIDSEHNAFGTLMNERSPEACFAIPEGYTWTGSIYLIDDNYIVFLVNDVHTQICLVKTCALEVLCTIPLGHKITHQIQGVWRTLNGCERVIYFTDELNDVYSLNIDRLTDYITLGSTFDPLDDSIWDVRKIKLFTSLQLPVVQLQSINNAGGFKTRTGTYQFAVRYLDANQNATRWSDLCNPIPIVTELLIDEQQSLQEIDGSDNALYPFTNKSITLRVNTQGSPYPFIQFAVLMNVNSTGLQENAGTALALDIVAVEPIVEYTFSGENTNAGTELTIEQLIQVDTQYRTAKTITEFRDRLILGNVSEQQYDWTVLQRIANDVRVKFTTSGLAVNDVNTSPTSGIAYFNKRSLMRNEVYALGIVFQFANGSESEAFHIPGRIADFVYDTPNAITGNVDIVNVKDTLNLEEHPRVNADYATWDTQLIPYTADALPFPDCETPELDYTPLYALGQCLDFTVDTTGELDDSISTDFNQLTIQYTIKANTLPALAFNNKSYMQVTITRLQDNRTQVIERYLKGYIGAEFFTIPFRDSDNYNVNIEYFFFTEDDKCSYDPLLVQFLNISPYTALGNLGRNVFVSNTAPNPNTQIPRWKVYNTAVVDTVDVENGVFKGNMGYYQTCTRYPAVKDCNSQFVYPTEIIDNKEVPAFIRHHRMPDTALVPHVLQAEERGVEEDMILPLGIDVFNINIPEALRDTIVSYKIVVGERNFENQLVIDKGFMLPTYHNVPFENKSAVENLVPYIDQGDVLTQKHTFDTVPYSIVAGDPEAQNSYFNPYFDARRLDSITDPGYVRYIASPNLFTHAFWSPFTYLRKPFIQPSYIKYERFVKGDLQYKINDQNVPYDRNRITDHIAMWKSKSSNNSTNTRGTVPMLHAQILQEIVADNDQYIPAQSVYYSSHGINNLMQNACRYYRVRTPYNVYRLNADEAKSEISVGTQQAFTVVVQADDRRLTGADVGDLIFQLDSINGNVATGNSVSFKFTEIYNDDFNIPTEGNTESALDMRPTQRRTYNDFFSNNTNNPLADRIVNVRISFIVFNGVVYQVSFNQDLALTNGSGIQTFTLSIPADNVQGQEYTTNNTEENYTAEVNLTYVALMRHNPNVHNNLYNIQYQFRHNNAIAIDNQNQTGVFIGDSHIGRFAFRKIKKGTVFFDINDEIPDDNQYYIYRDRHMFYGYYESDIHPELRSIDDPNDVSQYYYPKNFDDNNIIEYLNSEQNELHFFDRTEYETSEEDVFDDTPFKSVYNYNTYNIDYSKVASDKTYLSVASTQQGCEKCGNTFPTRFIYSNPSDEQKTVDDWRTFLPLNYKDLTARTGEITQIFELNNNLFVSTILSTYNVQPTNQQLELNTQTVSIGDGGLFVQPELELQRTTTGYAGNQHQFGMCVTPKGAVWCDAAIGAVFMMQIGQGVAPIHTLGMEEDLQSLLQYSPKLIVPNRKILDNPANPQGMGITILYDYDRSRVIISMRKYEPIGIAMRYIPERNVWIDVVTENVLDLNDSTQVRDMSWTLSFHTDMSKWISYHSYILNQGISLRQFFVSNVGRLTGLHNDIQHTYNQYFTRNYISVLEMVFRKSSLVSLIQENMQYFANVFVYDTDADNYSPTQTETFSHVWAYNSRQSTGLQSIVYKDNNPFSSVVYTAGSVYVDRTEQEWFINQLRDYVISNGAISKASYPMYVQGDIEPNVNVHNLSKNVFELEQLRDDYLVMRLYYNKQNRMQIKISQPHHKPSVR